ncbi:hypothetical protein CI102_14267 [Trichoderma harzianum]|uniref:Uncharacterized protein n=1 Tax=Trichoderma harzianum CBS 226.95 TaxID=983964 RepID=A0A2T4ALF8_TRIHA|nr:hypothetical protein M431DRAFT_505476 [Trichoderma harzianum CBS 226.95]PKK41367.1 hypothetical protein CI102_14267 [Trichoderma harzianum]PTB57916.1 hypothetical protein M431DRAFT_505476 [Trichoderma harzianum CBS 226.95]
MITLHDAAAQGSLTTDTLEHYKSASLHFNIDEIDRKGRTALAYASLKGHIDVVKVLLGENANVNHINDKNRTALWYASFSHSSVTQQRRREVIEYLLHKGADPDVQAIDGTTALMKLIEHRDPGAIKLLTDMGASTTIGVKKGANPVTIEEFAEATKDPAVIQAIKQDTLPAKNRDEIVTEIINYFFKSIGFMNHTLKGAVKTIFGIQGNMNQSFGCVPENMRSNVSNAADVPPEKTENLRNRIFTDSNMTDSFVFGDPQSQSQSQPQPQPQPQDVKTVALDKVTDDVTDDAASASVPLVSEISQHTTAEEFQASMMQFINDTGLDYFFEDGNPLLKTIASKAVELQGKTDNLLKEDKDIQDITKLALYQPVFYCDDSGSMKQGTRQSDQIDLVRRVARISTLLVPDGFGAGLLFINDKRDMNPKLKAEQVEEIMKTTKLGGKTRIGTQLEQKILKPLIYDVIKAGGKIERPILISCITDGCASGETRTKFKEAIVSCIEFLTEHDYPTQTVRFQISQIGNDSSAADFLQQLKEDDELTEWLYCTTQRLDEGCREFNENEEDLERWLLQTLMGPIASLGSCSD